MLEKPAEGATASTELFTGLSRSGTDGTASLVSSKYVFRVGS